MEKLMPLIPIEEPVRKGRLIPIENPQTTTYDPDTNSVLSHTAGLSAAEIKQNDAIQNLGDNPNNWLAGVKIKSDPTKSIFDDLIEYMDRNAKADPDGLNSFGIESRKAIVRGVQSGVESIAASPATSVMQAAENYQPEDILRPQEMSFGAGLLKQAQEPFILGKAWLYKATRSGDGNVVTEAKQDLVESNARLKHIEAQIPKARHVRNFYKGAQVGTNIIPSIGLAVVGSPLGAALFQYDLQSTSTYREQRAGGTEPLEALNRAAATGVGNAAVEFVGGQVTKKVFGELTGRFTSAVVESLNNAAQEGVQGAFDAAINQNVRQATYAEIFDSIVEQMAFGGGFGATLGFIGGNGVKSDEGVNFANPVGSPEFNKEVQEKYGVTEQEAISISEALVELRPAMEDAAKQVERNLSNPALAGSEAETLAVYKAGAEGVPMGEVIKGIDDGLTVSDAISKAKQSMPELKEGATEAVTTGRPALDAEAQLQQRIDDATLEAEILAKSEVKDTSEATITARITKLDSDIQALDVKLEKQRGLIADISNKASPLDTDVDMLKKAEKAIAKLDKQRVNKSNERDFLLTAKEKITTTTSQPLLTSKPINTPRELRSVGAEAPLRVLEPTPNPESIIDIISEALPQVKTDAELFTAPQKGVAETAGSLADIVLSNWRGLSALLNPTGNKQVDKLLDVFENNRLNDEIKSKFQYKLKDAFNDIYGNKFSLARVTTELRKQSTVKISNKLPKNLQKKFKNLTVSRARYIYMMQQNPQVLTQLYEANNLTQADLDAVNNLLTQEDKDFALAQMRIYQEQYNIVNPVYERIHGKPLNKVGIYFPTSRLAKGDATDVEDMSLFAGANYLKDPTFIKSRQEANTPYNINFGDTEIFARYLQEVALFTSFAEKSKALRTVLQSPQFTKDLVKKLGRERYNRIEKNLNFNLDLFSGNLKNSFAEEGGFAKKPARLFGNSVLTLNPKVGFMQLTGAFSYADEVSTLGFTKNLASFFANPKTAIRTLHKSQVFRDRYTNPDVLLNELIADNTLPWDVLKNRPDIKNLLYTFIRGGDALAIHAGGWAMYKTLVDSGTSPKEALAAVERKTVNTQQSTDLGVRAKIFHGPFSTMAQFLSAQSALLRNSIDTVIEYKQGKVPLKKVAKNLAITWVFMNALVTLATSGFDLPEDEDELWEFLNIMSTNLVGGIPVAGPILSYAIAEHIVESEKYQTIPQAVLTNAPGISDLIQAISDVEAEDITLDEYLEVNKSLATLSRTVGGITGLPLGRVQTAASGFNDIINGETDKGLEKVYGVPMSQIRKNYE